MLYQEVSTESPWLYLMHYILGPTDLVFIPYSSIGASIKPFQDGRHGSKMAAMAPRLPPGLQDGRHDL